MLHIAPPGYSAAIGVARSTLAFALFGVTEESQSQTFTTLYAFTSLNANGIVPETKLLEASDGNFYGTCTQGSPPIGLGTIYQLTPAGVVNLLFFFQGGGSDGALPNALVQGTDGNFYGTTRDRGTSGGGTVFKLTPGGVLTTLYRFSFAGVTGGQPMAGLIQGSDGNFYGTTSAGGMATFNPAGTIFKITPDGTLTTVHNFNVDIDGGTPHAKLIEATDGNFYGTTSTGGSNFGDGTVFQLTPGGTYTVLHVFHGGNTDGSEPEGGLIQASDGDFYGATTLGGPSDLGVVYKITAGGTFTFLHAFDGNDGSNPQGELVQAGDGNFYGVTGTAGTIFKITPQGQLTTVHFFNASTDGTHPKAGLTLGSDGNLYGVNSNNGPVGSDGTAFKVTLSPTTPAVLGNISTRLKVLTGDKVLIGGIVISGNVKKTVLFRALGPTLTSFHVPGALQDPTLELHDGNGALITTNDNWKIDDQTQQSQQAGITSTGFPPPDDRESAILRTLAPGNYTVIVRGKSNTTGVALVEGYDVSQAAPSGGGGGAKLFNISTRGFVDMGANVMIGGFVVGSSSRFLVRGLGPTLTQFHVPGALQDPTLELHDNNGNIIATNDNWKIDDATQQSQEAVIAATGFPPPNDGESAILKTLAAGNYTGIVKGKNNTTGVGLVEVYSLPP